MEGTLDHSKSVQPLEKALTTLLKGMSPTAYKSLFRPGYQLNDQIIDSAQEYYQPSFQILKDSSQR